jgi:hypothetical protein
MDLILPDYTWNEAKKIDCPFDYLVKIVNFPNRTTELIMSRIKRTVNDMREPVIGFNGFVESVENGMTAEQQEEKRLENVRRSARRAKKQVEYAIRSCGADHMLTLSTRENIQDRERFFEIFKRFVRLVREKDLAHNGAQKLLVTRSQKRIWQYVAVPELQKRGAFHMHIACVGKQELELLNACWYVALGGSPNDTGELTKGAVNVKFRQKRFGGQSQTHRTLSLVAYLVKYITKSFEESEELGINRYVRAYGIPKPTITRQFVWSSFKNNGAGYIECIQEIYAMADFMGLVNMEPWNSPDSTDFFVLRGHWE